MEAIGKLVQSRLLQHHRHHQQGLLQEGGQGDEDEEEEEGRVKSEVANDSIERGANGGSSRQSVGGTFSIDSLLR